MDIQTLFLVVSRRKSHISKFVFIVFIFFTVNLNSQNIQRNNSLDEKEESALVKVFPIDSSFNKVYRIYKIGYARPYSFELIEIYRRNLKWRTKWYESSYENKALTIKDSNLTSVDSYRRLFKKLEGQDFFIIQTDSINYSNIFLQKDDSVKFPVILPDDGVKYIVAIRKRTTPLLLYSFYSPESIYNTIKNEDMDLVGIKRFINILNIIRDQFIQNF